MVCPEVFISVQYHLAISQGYGAVGIQWHIGGGCYVITNAQDAQKAEHGIELNSKDCLYLVFAYRHKELWDGNALMPIMKKFIQHLENMPSNPIETIYSRATDVNGHNMRHLRLTGMLPAKNARKSEFTRHGKNIDYSP